MKNDTNSLHRKYSYIKVVRSASVNPRLPTNPDLYHSEYLVEDALNVIIDLSYDIPLQLKTLKMAEAMQASAAAAAAAQIEEQVGDTCAGYAVFSTLAQKEQIQASTTKEENIGEEEEEEEEDEFFSLTETDDISDEPIIVDIERVLSKEFKFNVTVRRELDNLENLKFENRFFKISGQSKNNSISRRNEKRLQITRTHELHSCKSDFTRISNLLCNVLNKVSVTLLEGFHHVPESILFELSSSSLIEMMNLRASYPAVFKFNLQNVILTYNKFVYRLDENIVRNFLADRWSYVKALKETVFQLTENVCERELTYFTRVLEARVEAFCHLVHLPPWISISLDGRERFCEFERNAITILGNKLSSLTSSSHQLIIVESDIMNCGENISEAGPTTAANIDNLNNIPLLNDSCDLEFISKVGGTGLVAENLRKQSLYVKFDPLVANEVDTLSMNGGGDTTLTNDISNLSLNDITIDSNCRAANGDRNNASTEVTDSNEPVGKLISVTPNKSPRKQTPKSSPKFSDTDPDDLNELKSLLLKQMKREETFKEEIDSIRREHEQTSLKLQNAEKEKSQLRNALELSQENEKKLKNELKERIKSKQQLSMVMEEYEKTISQMVTRRDEEKREFEASIRKVEAERDSAIQHLNNLENAFNDVHQKYERGKIVNDALKKNEDMLKKSLSEYEVTVKTVENKYELLKSHATSQLEKANQELELITQSYEKEQAKLKAMLRKSEIQINSLQNALDQKSKENQELAAVCDELIIKLSTHSNA